ncbi:HlyD family secretion protein [Geothrix sp. PMB-07]|uniref:HlyD family secretion protein n=1 Tax=Geothrix sp. PMB-07 TaxID=3068640 RepID=UPI002741E2E1|nr:HlyD family efflux transporter periplasmic adaptor subunit [Geothrix sp. PMB-07]WLT33477.1 HlyD family efflux transporter periplasmic adaptor subunit [Geothrix sp. PMB-07]
MDPNQGPKESLFRKEALEHLFQEEDVREPLRVSPPWTWSLLWVMAALVASSIAVSIFGKVEMISTSHGILQPAAGVRQLQAQVAGVVSKLYGHSGDRLRQGQPVARIEAAQLQSTLIETDRQLQLLRSEGQGFTAREEKLTQDQIQAIQSKIAKQKAQIASFRSSVEHLRGKAQKSERLLKEGYTSQSDVAEAKDALNAGLRQQEAAEQQLVQIMQELSALESARQRQLWQHSQEMSGIQSKRDALDATLRQTEILAPVDGFLEALVARPGDVVQAGQTLAKLIPEDSTLQAVAFLAEKDRPYVRPGSLVNLELEAYPFAQHGTLKGRVSRIGNDLVSPYEIREVLGEEAKLEVPSFRVEIEILPDRPKRLSHVTLRPNMLLQVRFTLKRQSIITLALDPLRRWLE